MKERETSMNHRPSPRARFLGVLFLCAASALGVVACGGGESGERNGRDNCPDDPRKFEPGLCGCGIPDTAENLADADGDGVIDCLDRCPGDPAKSEPGLCGCGATDNDADADGDGTPDCVDECPADPWKSGAPGEDDCGCGHTRIGDACFANIDSAADLLAYRDDWAAVGDAILKRDIDLGAALSAVDGAIEWRGIGTGADSRAYAGRFLGNGKRIFCTDGDGARLALKCASRKCGLFAQVDGALIQDLWLDLDVEAAFADREEDEFAGLLAGEARGGSTLSNVHATGTLLATQGNASVLRAGGLVGELSTSAMFDATAEVEVEVRAADDGDAIYLGGLVGLIDGAQPYDLGAMGDVTLIGVAAGFVGGLAGAIEAGGASSGAQLTNAYALGAVAVRTGELAGETIREGAIGGLVGALGPDSALANAYALGTVSGRGSDHVGAVIGSPAASSTTARLYFWDHDGMTSAPTCAGAGVAACTALVASTTAGVTGLFVVDADEVQTPLVSLLNGYLGPDGASQIGCARDEGDDPTFCAVGGTGPRYRLWENEVRLLGDGDYKLPTLKGL